MKAEDENEAMRDALDHIIRTCDAAQNQTRRLLWIRERASCALNDSAAWKELDLPPNRARQNENRRIRDADTITALQAERDALRAALKDMHGGWQYIRSSYGDLYGVGWDRCDANARAALGEPSNG